MTEEMLGELEGRLGYCFADKGLLRQAFTHSSYANEMKINKYGDYERLEFLGDAVLELVTSDFLFRQRKENSEGRLTKLRASMVREPALAFCAREIALEQYILLGKGEETTGGRGRDSIVSDVMEAVIGAIYLDGGLEAASAFIHRTVLSDLAHKQLFYDAKTTLQEIVQQENNGTLHYKLVREEGPQHEKIFDVEAYVGETKVGEGSGHSKKAAEQQAAYQALLARQKQ
ncbi:MAG: ribonuclease III [Bacteroidales bacterium]|nr:ribonuclease III [Bacteroidales bacterium]MCM1415200.1 ribonuclease III [bacterium]MCM1424697.1 ribonuclease III [bacterium]